MRPRNRSRVPVSMCLLAAIVVTSFGQDVVIITTTNEPEPSNQTSVIDEESPALQNGSVLSVLKPFAPDLFTTEETTLDETWDPIINTTEECPRDSLLPCVTKCCPFGQTLGTSRKCVNSNIRFIPQFTILVDGFNESAPPVNETETRGGYNLIIQNLCLNNRYRLEPQDNPADEFHLLYNGSLWLPEMKPTHIMLASNQYCMEVFVIDSEEVMLPLMCFIEEPVINQSSFHFILYPVGLIISVPFLLATFVVFTMLSELRNLHGKCLATYALCLAVAYVLLSVVQLGGEEFATDVCISVAFAVQFSFIASFFWLSVLCFNTWRTVYFHEGDLSHRLHKTKERTYFLFYSLYAWTFTIIFIVVTMVMNFTPTIPSSFVRPRMGVKRCWFGTESAAIPYFYGPIGALIVVNFILFIMTVTKLIYDHHHKEICIRSPKQTVQLCLTFFFMMGINWVMEMVSWAAGGPNFIWYITDICNTLQGVVIFAVFVMDDIVWELCQTKLMPKLASYVPCCKDRYVKSQQHDPSESVSHYDAVNGEVSTVYNFPEKDEEIEK